VWPCPDCPGFDVAEMRLDLLPSNPIKVFPQPLSVSGVILPPIPGPFFNPKDLAAFALCHPLRQALANSNDFAFPNAQSPRL
jgi:hypothetical protein